MIARPRNEAPLVAVSGSDQAASWGAWNDRATLVPTAYMKAVRLAGGVPVIVAESSPAEVVADRVDGVLLTGGSDLDPQLYGQIAHAETQTPDFERDSFEVSLLEAALERDLPVLAVCRGLQVLNVIRGGTLHQHLPETVGHSEHLPKPGTFSLHRVRIGPGTQLSKLIGRDTTEVPTHHHQAIDGLGRGLTESAWADDGVIEAVEDAEHRFLIAVQWHPEVGEDLSLFRALVAAAGCR